jgi:hypothetical protein
MKFCQVKELLDSLDEKTKGVVLQTALWLEEMFDFTRGNIAIDWLLELLQKRYGDMLGQKDPYLLASSLYREICAKLKGVPTHAAHANKVIKQLATGGELYVEVRQRSQRAGS